MGKLRGPSYSLEGGEGDQRKENKEPRKCVNDVENVRRPKRRRLWDGGGGGGISYTCVGLGSVIELFWGGGGGAGVTGEGSEIGKDSRIVARRELTTIFHFDLTQKLVAAGFSAVTTTRHSPAPLNPIQSLAH